MSKKKTLSKLNKYVKAILSDPAVWRITIRVILTFIEWCYKK